MPFVYFGFLMVMAVWLFWALVWAIMLLAWPIALLIAGVLGWRALGRRWSASWRSGSCRRARTQAPRGNGSVPESNSAFAAYRQEAMNRLDEEQDKFREFLQRLRRSRDKQEFDQYIAARRNGRPAILDGDARATGA